MKTSTWTVCPYYHFHSQVLYVRHYCTRWSQSSSLFISSATNRQCTKRTRRRHYEIRRSPSMAHNSPVTTPTALSKPFTNLSMQAMAGISTPTYYHEKMYFTNKRNAQTREWKPFILSDR